MNANTADTLARTVVGWPLSKGEQVGDADALVDGIARTLEALAVGESVRGVSPHVDRWLDESPYAAAWLADHCDDDGKTLA